MFKWDDWGLYWSCSAPRFRATAFKDGSGHAFVEGIMVCRLYEGTVDPRSHLQNQILRALNGCSPPDGPSMQLVAVGHPGARQDAVGATGGYDPDVLETTRRKLMAAADENGTLRARVQELETEVGRLTMQVRGRR